MVPLTDKKICYKSDNRGRFEGFQANHASSLPSLRDASILIIAQLDKIYHCRSQGLSN